MKYFTNTNYFPNIWKQNVIKFNRTQKCSQFFVSFNISKKKNSDETIIL